MKSLEGDKLTSPERVIGGAELAAALIELRRENIDNRERRAGTACAAIGPTVAIDPDGRAGQLCADNRRRRHSSAVIDSSPMRRAEGSPLIEPIAANLIANEIAAERRR